MVDCRENHHRDTENTEAAQRSTKNLDVKLHRDILPPSQTGIPPTLSVQTKESLHGASHTTHTRSYLDCCYRSSTNQHISNNRPRGRREASIDRRRQRHHH